MLIYIKFYNNRNDFQRYVMKKIGVIILVYHSFNICKTTKKLIAKLQTNNRFICKDYILINPIFLLRSLLIIFNKILSIFLL